MFSSSSSSCSVSSSSSSSSASSLHAVMDSKQEAFDALAMPSLFRSIDPIHHDIHHDSSSYVMPYHPSAPLSLDFANQPVYRGLVITESALLAPPPLLGASRSFGGGGGERSGLDEFDAYSLDTPSHKVSELYHSDHAFSFSSYEQQQPQNHLMPAVLEEVPLLMDASHFITHMFPNDILAEITAVLEQNSEVCFERVPAAYQIKATLCHGGNTIPFHVTVFKREHEFVVEFLRLTGNHADFYRMYRQTVAALSAEAVAEPRPEFLSAHDSEMSPSLAMQQQPQLQWDPVSGPKTLECLLQMIASGMVDVAREALRALAPLMCCPELRQFLVEHAEQVVQTATSAYVTRDWDLARGLSAILAQLSVDDKVCEALCGDHRMVEQLVNVLNAEQEHVLESRRKVAETLKNLCHSSAASHATELLGKNADYVCVVKAATRCSDATIRQHATAVLHSVGSFGFA